MAVTFGAVFPRVMRPVFGPGLAAVSANWWQAGGATGAVAVYQPKGAASLAASYVNLANPGTYNAAPGNAPAWATGTGWTFTAASMHYLATSIIPAADSWSYIVRFASATSPAGALFGFLDSFKRTFILPYQAGLGVGYANHNTTLTVSPDLASGVLAVTGTDAYRNGVDDGDIGDWGIGTTLEIYIGAIKRSASITNYFTGSIIALAIYNTTLSGPQVSAVSAAAAAL